MPFTPTPEQSAIVEAAQSSSDNLLVSALAGAAKTSTLVLIAEALHDTEILCLAFNKRIAVEMQSRLPANCKAMTLNALGHRVWSEATGRRVAIDAGKVGDLLKAYIDENLGSDDRREAWDNFADLSRVISFGKACGYIPTDTHPQAKRLMDDDEFFGHLEESLPPWQQALVRDITLQSLRLAFEGKCDFDDQILMPTIFHGAFPRFPLVLVDEAQDLSALNHATLAKLAKRRLIAVGDQCQSIYGFRGAHLDSMEQLKRSFSMRELTLSISFRCPQEIVKHAQWRAPHMRWPEWAKPGSVSTLSSWTAAELPDEAAIICRNNAPLFSCAIKLLKNGRYSELAGNDIGKSLLKIMRKFGGNSLSQAEVLAAIDSWADAKKAKAKSRAHAGIDDRAECMRIFARQGADLGDAVAYAEHLFAARGPLKLMTGHKSKGLEFDHVYFLDQSLVGDEDQDRNLRYVIITRAKESLTYINLCDFEDEANG